LKKSVRYSQLVKRLRSPSRREQKKARRDLERAGSRAESALIRAVSSDPDPLVREEAAELLGRLGSAFALPSLVAALKDPILFVRHDALWAIESIVGLRPASLACWLDLDINHPTEVYRRVSKWWRVNQRFLSDNRLLGAEGSRRRSKGVTRVLRQGFSR
jgi:hypothetical protein